MSSQESSSYYIEEPSIRTRLSRGRRHIWLTNSTSCLGHACRCRDCGVLAVCVPCASVLGECLGTDFLGVPQRTGGFPEIASLGDSIEGGDGRTDGG